MELWIRVQKNKKLNQGLVKVEDLILEKNKENEWSIRQSCDTLAIYKTEKRALEVLDEIQNILNPMIVFKNCNCTKDMLDKIKEVGACVVSDNSHIEQLSTCVYEMPDE